MLKGNAAKRTYFILYVILSLSVYTAGFLKKNNNFTISILIILSLLNYKLKLLNFSQLSIYFLIYHYTDNHMYY